MSKWILKNEAVADSHSVPIGAERSATVNSAVSCPPVPFFLKGFFLVIYFSFVLPGW